LTNATARIRLNSLDNQILESFENNMSDASFATTEAPSKNRLRKSNLSGDFSIDLLAIFRRRFVSIVASCVLGLALAVAYFLFLPATYESTAVILLMQNDSGLMASKMRTGEGSVSDDLLATHMNIIQSERVVKAALEKAQLAELPSIVENMKSDQTPSQFVIDNLYVTRGGSGAARDARILNLAFRHSNPEDCQRVVAAVLEEYREFVKSKFRDINQEAVGLISKARLEIEADIESIAEEYRQFREQAPLLASREGSGNIHAQRYEELAAEISQLQISINEAEGRLNLVRKGLERLGGSGGPQLEKLALIDKENAERLGILVSVERGEANSAAFQALQPERMAGATSEYTALLGLKAQLSQAIDEFGPKHPAVKTLQNQVREMEQFYVSRQDALQIKDEKLPLTPDDIMQAYVGLLDNDLQALRGRQADLERQMIESEAAAKELVVYELQDEGLLRQRLRQEDLYNSVVERLRDINMQQDSTALIQEVIQDPAPGEQVSPNALLAAVIALLTSCILAGSSVLVAELSDKRVHAATDLEEIYGVKVISHLPDFQRDIETRAKLKSIARNKPRVSPVVLTLHDPKSRISEAFRGIRTQLLFALRGEHKVLAVSSPNQGDGKSTITANLAVSMAYAGKSVLLIDCDMRRPNIDKLFGLQNHLGLADVVAGKAELNDCVQSSDIENLSWLPTGKLPDNPAELLASVQFRDLIELLRDKFDYLILDCPPLLPVTDPAIIAPLADQILLVTTLNADGIPQAQHCQRTLASVGGKLAGVIVNRAGEAGAKYAYSSYDYGTTKYQQYVPQ